MRSLLVRVSFLKHTIWRFVLFIILILLSFWLIVAVLNFLQVRLRYQWTESMPSGFYLQYPSKDYQVGDNIVFYPNKKIETLMVDRGWLNQKEPLLKAIIASEGDKVCIKNQSLWVNGQWMGKVYMNDRKDKPLPQLKFCKELKENEFWVMGTSSIYSFDSRYFGIINKTDILGKVVKL